MIIDAAEPSGPGRPGQRLLVASDCSSADALKNDLQRHSYEASSVTSGAAALRSYHGFDLVLLDTELPDLDGVSVCRFIREESDVPIIGFTSSEAEVDRVLLLEAGCDDCVDIPYRARELVARIKAVLRRSGAAHRDAPAGQEDCGRLEFGPLVIDFSRREALLDGDPLSLTRKEFDLLYRLATEPQRIFQRHELMSDVWDYPADNRLSVQESRTIDTHVSSLRGKLGNGEWITTIRGVGFRFGAPVPEPDAVALGPGSACLGLDAAEADVVRPRLLKLRSASGSGTPAPW